MKKFTQIRNTCVLFCITLISICTYSQVTIDSENCEGGSFPFTLWQDGGSRCSVSSASQVTAVHSIALERGSTPASTTYTNDIDLTPYSSASISFNFKMLGFDNTGDDFIVEFSNNGGGSYTQIGNYVYSSPYSNLTIYPVSINVTNVGATSFSNTCRFRIRNDSGSNDFVFIDDIVIQAFLPGPEIDVQGLGVSIPSGDVTPITTDNTDYGTQDTGTTTTNTFTIHNIGSGNITISNLGTGISITGSPFFTINTEPALNSTIGSGSSVSFSIDYSPTAVGTHTATVSIDNTDTDENPYTFTIQGNALLALTEGPGGVTSDLKLWLKSTDGLSYTDGQDVSLWSDQGRGADATVNTAGQEPTFRNNSTDNINFNPVLEFDGIYSTFLLDSDFSYDNTTRDFMEGTSGFYTQDIFVVLIPDDTTINSSFGFMDIFCGDADFATNEEDGSGIGFGDYSGRFTGEVLSYAYSTQSGGVGYGVAETSGSYNYDNPGIINTRNNSGATQQELYYNANNVEDTQNDIPSFANVNNSRFWIGRSEGWEASLNARVAEIITYSSRKNDASLTDERNRIQSYLAIKYGITLGVNGTSQNYVDSAGNIIWDASADGGAFNYDIAGIGRDDDSELNQKQSRSVNSTSVVTIGHKDITTTNSGNTNNFDTDLDYMVWGHNNAALSGSSSITINLGASTTSVTTLFDRRWKIVENRPTGSNDILDVKVSIPSAVLPAKAATEEYAMIVSSTSTFGATDIVDVIPLVVNGSNFETWYDFDNTRYFTFGIASGVTGKYNVEFAAGDFLVGEDSVDLNSAFTVSGWVRNLANGGSFVAKGSAYDFRINATGNVEIVINGTTQLTSATAVNDALWHHIACTYNGGTLRLFIDGVEDGNSLVSGVPAPSSTNDRFAIGVNYTDKNTISTPFNGDIDEIRVWDRALSQAQIQYIMNQEIEDLTGSANGVIIPNTITKNEVISIPWNDIQAYHNINEFYGTTVIDGSSNDNWVRIKYLVPGKDIMDNQTAPLPYNSIVDGGSWDAPATWENGSELYMPGTASIVNANVTVDWNIVNSDHNITMDNSALPAANNDNRTLLGLISGATKELTVSGDSGLTVTHYLELNGSIDLEGESQLIQTDDSVLVVGANGDLEKDQQGTADTFTYNYWSSPVGVVNTSSTNDTYTSSYTIPDVLRDGTNPVAPANINFLTSGFNGTNTNPIGLADYWIWKFADQPDDDYSAWQHVRSTGNMLAGEGYTMKGPGTGSILTDQNYVFNGKPNNGDIILTISANNDYLVGNPYASAIDALEFLSDNPVTSGTLYFWEHWGGGSHNLGEYQGGYALYNYAGGVGAPSYGVSDPDVNPGGTATKLPGQFIPVSQGFFVYSPGGGTIRFENDQRVFEREGGNSIFVRTNSDTYPLVDYNEDHRMKFRIGFDSKNNLHRQLLLTVDPNASEDVDWGYDGKLNEEQIDDMYWIISGGKYVIQGRNVVDTETIVPLGIHVRNNGFNSITIDHLENVPDEVEIYVHDNVLEIYHDLRQSDYQVNLTAGSYLDRFTIVFTNPTTLDLTDDELNQFVNVFYDTDTNNLIVENPNRLEIQALELFNIIGQKIFGSDEISNDTNKNIKIKNISTGTYIVNISTDQGKISKKVLIK